MVHDSKNVYSNMISNTRDIRRETLSAYEVGRIMMLSALDPSIERTGIEGTAAVKLRSHSFMLSYAAKHGTTSKRRIPVDVNHQVELWRDTVVRLATAHNKDDYDAAEATLDDLLTPFLRAPVKQIREFWEKLLVRLKGDKDVPMIIWRGFEVWHKVIIKNSQDKGIVRLKTKLAREIAELVEEDVKPQLMEAMVRALRWRDPEQLQEVKEAIQSGQKPKVRGRESCLFLEVGKGKNKKTVML